MDLEVGLDGHCGGPLYQSCSSKEQPLVCRFVSGTSRQNASMHYGRCSRQLPVGSQCNTELFSACKLNGCNTKVDPCQAGSKCTSGKCVAAAKTNVAAEAQGEEAQGEEAND